MVLVWYWYGTGCFWVGNWLPARVVLGSFEGYDYETTVPTPCGFIYALLAAGIHYALSP